MKIAAGQSKQIPKCFLAIALCAASSVCGCGQKVAAPTSANGENSSPSTTAAPPELPLDQQTEQKLDPLTKEDVELYLKVMRAAADRVKNPTASDHAALDGAKKILAAGAAGHLPTPDDVKTLQRASLVSLYMDQIVAEDMKLDARTYRGIAEAVEAVLPSPASAAASGPGGIPAPDHAPTPLEVRLSAVNATNQKFLAPCSEEIQELIAAVRNPANLPK